MNQVRGQGIPVVLVDGGDCFFMNATKQAPPRAEESSDLRKAKAILFAYNIIGYQAVGLGPTDLQLGVEKLLELQKDAKFPFLCANLVDRGTRKPIFTPSVVLPVAGVRFGIYSVMFRPNDTYLKRVAPDGDLLDPEETTRSIVADLKTRCDIVLALSHLNLDENEHLLDEKLGIDVMVDPLAKNGTKTLWVDDDQYHQVRGGTHVLRIDGQGSRVGVFEMYFDKGSQKLAAFRGYDMPLEPHILRHPETQRVLDEVAKGRNPPLVAAVGSTPRLTSDFLGEEGCGSCHEEQLAFWKGTKHATTFATLEKTGDQTKPECFICHTYGYGVAFASLKDLPRFRNVQCEACHGAKPGHAENPKSVRLGPVSDETCWGCHNGAITQRPFNATEAWPRAACPKIKR